ncbi:BPSL1445 family SYLF domain-containing lipoprotein [Paraburkholderia humisilvae]|uniref:Ysc84 actin-binding domain-containing protein n=1 Tax=Paraburkholderia humisilvae TaxID=627669 RepID=A0A6J5EHC8_9BURK|nr:YSC84-related protein [Paraburkholderia humisilvae]CAB3765899.1 hypothetical protein LMG29542_05259 [Paraburkholderia humisilvae]
MQRRKFISKSSAIIAFGSLALVGCTVTQDSGASAATNRSKRQSIDASVDGTMSRLFSTIGGSQELVSKAQGILVFPSVIQAGFIVGGQYGEGALRVDGKSVGYYSTLSASIGLEAGAQSKALIFCFMTQDALDDFRNADGWSAGADASVAIVKIGANGVVDTDTATTPVEVFVLTNAGLMADVSLDGTKVTRLKI